MWIPATNTESLHQGYLDVARQLNILGWEDEKTNVRALVQEYLSKNDMGKWLLVFDNADDVDMWLSTPTPQHEDQRTSNQASRRLIDYLPKNRHGCIIFTSRNRKAAVKLAQQNIIDLPEMDEEIATQLLSKCLANHELVEKQQDAKALLKELTCLPLAIVQAAAYINENGITLADYIGLLAEKEEEVIDLLSEDFEDDGRYRDVKNPVAITWLISFDQIKRYDALAVEYLSFMACIDFKDIPQSLLPPGSSPKKEVDAIGTLTSYSFVNRRPVDLALDLHRLVHLATRNWLRKERLLTHSIERTLLHLAEVYPDDDHKNRSIWRTYLPHARRILDSDLIDKDDEKRLCLMWKYARCLYSDGRWDEAEELFSQILETEKNMHGTDYINTQNALAWVASTYRNQGRWTEAEELFVQVMETRKKTLGDNHPSTLTSMANLASTYRNQGRWTEAEELFVQVMETSKKTLGDNHPSTLTSMANLASTYSNQGRWTEAEELFVQVMETSKKTLGDNHPSTLTSMVNLASTYRNQGRWTEAEELFVQVMETRKKTLGDNHPSTLTSMNNLAFTWKAQGRLTKALQLMDNCVQQRRHVMGVNHPHFLLSHAALAKWRTEQADKSGTG